MLADHELSSSPLEEAASAVDPQSIFLLDRPRGVDVPINGPGRAAAVGSAGLEWQSARQLLQRDRRKANVHN